MLDYLREAAGLCGVGNADPRVGGNDQIFFTANQHCTTVAPGVDNIPSGNGTAADGSLNQPRRDHGYLSRAFGN